jgi:DNA-binding transcriptional LysR family regulator
MNIENIRAFLEVSQTGSFQQAARNLNITQSAMSARIKALETELNRILFLRRRNGTVLTPGGQRFFRHATSLVRNWELARQESALCEDFNSVVGLGVQLNHWHSVVTPWLRWMETHNPDLATHIQSDYSSRLMELLRDGAIDVAILYEPQQIPGVTIEQYSDEELVLVSSEQRSVTEDAVPGYIFVDWGQSFRVAHSRLFPGIATHRITVGLADVGLGHILSQGGSAYLLRSAIEEHLKNKDLFIVEGAPDITISTYMVHVDEPERQDVLSKAIKGLRAIKELSP